MTDTKTQGGAPVPPRAEPLQPDRPGRGDDTMPAEPDAARDRAESDAARQRERQSRDALDNVREGYR